MRGDYSIIDLYPYGLLILYLFCIYFSRVSERCKVFFIVLGLFLFSVCRYNVGWDYYSYVKVVKTEDYERYEFLSRLILKLASDIDFYPLVFILFAGIQLLTLSLAIKKLSIQPSTSWLLYALFPLFFLQDLSTIRQGVATALVFYSYTFSKRGNIQGYITSIIVIFIASLFQISAWYGLLIIPLSSVRLTKSQNWLFFVISFFIGPVLSSLLAELDFGGLSERFSIYANSTDTVKTSTLNYLYVLLNTVILCKYDKLRRINSDNVYYIQLANWGVVTFNAFVFEPITSTRLSVFFLLFWLLLLPSFCKIYKSSFLILSPFVVLHFVYLWIYISAYNHGVLDKVSFIPYSFWWNHI